MTAPVTTTRAALPTTRRMMSLAVAPARGDSEITDALLHRIREDAEHADHREQQREARRTSSRAWRGSDSSRRFPCDIFERPHVSAR